VARGVRSGEGQDALGTAIDSDGEPPVPIDGSALVPPPPPDVDEPGADVPDPLLQAPRAPPRETARASASRIRFIDWIPPIAGRRRVRHLAWPGGDHGDRR
jgi:hypothetical protein